MKSILLLSFCILSLSAYSSDFDSSRYYFEKGKEEKLSKRYLVASGYFNQAIRLNANFTEAYIENGLVNKEMRRLEDAKSNFVKALALDSNNETIIAELAEIYFNYRQYEQAIEFAQKCKTCAGMDRIMAISYYQMEDYARAERLLVALSTKNPTDAELAYITARNYLDMGFEAKAIPFYVRAISLDKSKAGWHYELGLIYYNNGNFKGAVESFNQAINHGYARNNDVNENLGFAYLHSGDVENGEKLLNEIVTRKAGDKELIMNVAYAFYNLKQYDKSLDYCQRLLELDMKDGKALYQAGLCFQKKGLVERGMQMCDKAIELDPSLAALKTKKHNPGM